MRKGWRCEPARASGSSCKAGPIEPGRAHHQPVLARFDGHGRRAALGHCAPSGGGSDRGAGVAGAEGPLKRERLLAVQELDGVQAT